HIAILVPAVAKSFHSNADRRPKKSTTAQHCIRAIAGAVVKSRSVHLINFGGGGQVIALKSATALILDRCEEIPSGFRHIARRLCGPKPLQGLRTSEGFAKCKTLRKASGRCASLYRTTEKSSSIRLTKELKL